MSFFTYYILSSTKYPQGCRHSRHGHRMAGSPTALCGLQKIMAPPPPTSEFVGMTSYGPSCFLHIMDNDVESDGFSIGDVAPSHRPSWECAKLDALEQPPRATESSRTHASPGPHTETSELTHEHEEELQ